MCDQVKAATVGRLLEKWGRVEDDTLDRVLQVLHLVFERGHDAVEPRGA